MQSLTLFLPVYTKKNDTLENCLRLFRDHNRAVLASNEMGLHLARVDTRRRPFTVLMNMEMFQQDLVVFNEERRVKVPVSKDLLTLVLGTSSSDLITVFKNLSAIPVALQTSI